MTVSRSTSPSEGEIVESDSEKATKSQPSTKDISVDRQSRKLPPPSRAYTSTESESPSPPPRSPAGTSRRDNNSHGRDNRRRNASRSRSPYRENRGHKRPRDDDHHDRASGGQYGGSRGDRRGHKGQYNDRRHDSGKSFERSSAYRDGQRSRYDDRRYAGKSRDKKSRTVSRSPPPRGGDRKRSGDHQRSKGGDSRFGRDKEGNRNRPDRESGGQYSREQSVGEPSSLGNSFLSKSDAELQKSQTLQNGGSKSGSQSVADKYVPREGGGTMLTGDRDRAARFDAANGAADVSMDAEPLDEAALIEQRRKRREAIKAKHRDKGTPLLVQALSLNASTTPTVSQPDTPSSLSHLDSPKITPPHTPREGSAPDSPSNFEFAKDADLANDNEQEVDDEPSAADYDPTQDMQEDKLRHDHRNQGIEELSASACDETKTQDQDILMPDATAEKPVKKAKNEFDMFAEDEDEDDMFADTAKAVPVPKANAIDMSMLDDWDDEEGYYKIILGELLDSRYHVQLNLGKGMFSAVVRALDEQTKKLVAIKIIRSNETMRKAALKEIEILGTLKQADPDDKKHVIRLERYFEHKGHLCMVFENLSINLREVLKKFGRGVGINLRAVRAYAHQMFLGLSLLRKCNILHADLKPDNVLVNESRNMLKICDLGSASDASDNEITPYLVSRFYRAPEIILGMPYDFAIDTWSVGCTLFELYTGKILFTGRTNNQMLRSIMECRGKFSHKILRKAKFAELHFDDLLNFRSVETDQLSGKDVVRMINVSKPTRDLRTRLMVNAKGMADVETKELNSFVDLLERCLNLNPEKRCTPNEALKHPFIMRSKS